MIKFQEGNKETHPVGNSDRNMMTNNMKYLEIARNNMESYEIMPDSIPPTHQGTNRIVYKSITEIKGQSPMTDQKWGERI